MILLDVIADFYVQIDRQNITILQFFQLSHFFFEVSWLFIDVLNKVSDCATRHRKSDDANEHDNDADDLLEQGRCRHIAIADRSDCGEDKVEGPHVDATQRLVWIIAQPRLVNIGVHLCYDDPYAGENVRRHRKVG